MKVLHVAQPVSGGVAAVVADLARDQRERGWEPVVACPPEGRLRSRITGLGVPVADWEATRGPGPGTAREVASLRRIIAERRPDVVHLHGSKAGLAGRLAVRGRIPTVFQPHLWSFRSDASLAGRLALVWERAAARWTRLFLCVSADEARDGVGSGVRGRMVVVPNGVDVTGLVPVDAARAKAEAGLGPGPTVVCVGRLAPLKGQDLLLDAWPEVRAAVPGARLALVGGGPLEAELRAHATAADDSVLWLGHQDAPHRYLAAADVVAVPSRAEGMALVPLEAMAMGRSVVAYDVGGIRESLGDTGAVLPPADVPALARAIITRLDDAQLRDDEGTRARQRAETLFDRRRMAAQVAELMEELVSDG